MKFKLIIDKSKEEEIVATVHAPSPLTDRIQQLILSEQDTSRITAYSDDEICLLSVEEIECVTVLDGKTFVIDIHNHRYRVKQRLYELEKHLPAHFIRINKSSLANVHRLKKFRTAFSGAVDAVFQCGYTEYVSRRCFSQIKRRFD